MTDTSFKKAYGTLQAHAETLRNQQEPNIDDLLEIVKQSLHAYNTCKGRIDEVEAAMEQALNDTATSDAAPATVSAGESTPKLKIEISGRKSSDPSFDDDIPF